MRVKEDRRVGALVLACFAVAAMAAVLIAPSPARACHHADTMLTVGPVSIYDSSYGRALDGIITNGTSVTVSGVRVLVRWVEDEDRVQEVWVGGVLSPDESTTFRYEWPEGVPEGWTPIVEASGYEGATDYDVVLTVDSIEQIIPDVVEDTGAKIACETGTPARRYTAQVTNNSTVPVSAVDVVGGEWLADELVDVVDPEDCPEFIGPGESATIGFYGRASSPETPTPEVVVLAKERPRITLACEDLTPGYGTTISMVAALRKNSGALLTGGRTLKVYYSVDGESWKYVPQQTESGVSTFYFTPSNPTFYKAVYWGDGRYGEAFSSIIKVVPHDVATISAPSSVDQGQALRVRGRINGGADSAGDPVKIYKSRYSTSLKKWVSYGFTSVAADRQGDYLKSLTMSKSGKWRVRSWRSGVGYTKFDYVSVTQ